MKYNKEKLRSYILVINQTQPKNRDTDKYFRQNYKLKLHSEQEEKEEEEKCQYDCMISFFKVFLKAHL